MPLFETESLVLKSHNLAEADRIVVFFTREHGMIRGVAKGAKRLKSRFGSTLEPFTIVNLEYFQKEDRELVSIQRVDLIRSAFDRASDPEYLKTLAYLADLLTALLPPHDPNETLYRMARACLEAEPEDDAALAALRLYFELWLLRLGGYLPDWNKCYRCRRVLNDLETVEADSDMRLICGDCAGRGAGHLVPPAVREIFFRVQRITPAEFTKGVAGDAEAVTDLSGRLRRLITAAIGHDKPFEREGRMRTEAGK